MAHNQDQAVRTWLKRQYDDIKGNLKWWVLLGILGGVMTAFSFLVSGLPWWKHALIVFFFTVVSLWAGIATWASRRRAGVDGQYRQIQKEGMLTENQMDALRLASRLRQGLRDFIKREGSEPTADLPTDGYEDWETASNDLWARKLPWRTKLRSKYVSDFEKDAVDMYHRLVQDGVLNEHFGALVGNAHTQKDIEELARLFRVEAMTIEDE
jgi:hypothetical protein